MIVYISLSLSHDPFITKSNEETSQDILVLENLEEMFPQYYMDGDAISWFKSSTTHHCVTCLENIKEKKKD